MLRLTLNLDCKDWIADPLHDVINAGIILSALVCSRSLCRLTKDGNKSATSTRAECGKLHLECNSVPDDVFAATCSAVADVNPATHLKEVFMDSMNPDRWSWLVYALCCRSSNDGAPENPIPRLTIREKTLTNADISAIERVLRTGYPLATLNEDHGAVYGLVDIDEGTQLWPREFLADDSNALVASCKFRCRACFNPANSEFIDIVVPGYGTCKTRLGSSTQFTPDPSRFHANKKRLCDSLELYFDSVDNVGLVIDLLELLFGGVRKLTLHVYNDDSSQPIVDLSVLATVCPLLEDFSTTKCTVVASSHDEALQKLPIRKIGLWQTDTVADVISCLRDPALRMAQELVEFLLSPSNSREFDEEETRAFEALDDEFLPVTKKKLAAQSKAALISVVMTGSTGSHSTVESKAIHHLDANILSLIFVFASTPAQRTLCCY